MSGAIILLNQPVGGKIMNVLHYATAGNEFVESDPGPTENLFSSVGLNVGDTCNLKLSFWYKSSVATANPAIDIAGTTINEAGDHDYQLAPSTGWRFCEYVRNGLIVSEPNIILGVFAETTGMSIEWFADFKIVRV